MTSSRIALSFTLFSLATLGPAQARAGDVREECAQASEAAQALHLKGKLVEEREKLVTCARAECPGIVRSDCERWLADAEKALPSIVLDVKDAREKDVAEVRVTIDGRVVAERLDGRALPLDPGLHDLKLEHGADPALVDSVLVREGEKGRVLRYHLGAPAPRVQAPVKQTKAPSGLPAATWILGGLGVASLGAFVVLDVTGQAKFDDCAKTHACTPSDKSALDAQRVAAWATLGVGVAALGGALAIAWTRPRASAGGVAWTLLVAPAGLGARLAY